jgi:hypothetical protein
MTETGDLGNQAAMVSGGNDAGVAGDDEGASGVDDGDTG